MSDFLQYHKHEKMGYPGLDVDNLSVYTSKSVSVARGDRVWLLVGEGAPREYYLRAVFSVFDICDSDKPEFLFKVSGRNGQLFDPMPRLTMEVWFPGLRRSQGNFAFGFSRIDRADALHGLNTILRERNDA